MDRSCPSPPDCKATYREWPAPAPLSSHVACIWSRGHGISRVLPDGCVDLVWTGADLIIAGPATRALVPRVSPDATKLGIRFRIGAASAALGFPACELLDRSVAVGELWADGNDLTERVGDAIDSPSRLCVMLDAIAARVARAPAPDPVVRAGLAHLGGSRTSIRAASKRLSISERQLRRRVETSVGYSPRTLARVLRLQRFLQLVADGRELARVAAECGYADQPHLTRECRDLTGLPPAALIAGGAVPAGERLTQA